MVNKGFKKSKMVSFTPLIMVTLALLFALACGSAARAAPEVVEKEMVVEKEVVK